MMKIQQESASVNDRLSASGNGLTGLTMVIRLFYHRGL